MNHRLLALLLGLAMPVFCMADDDNGDCADSHRVHHLVIVWMNAEHRNEEAIDRLLTGLESLRKIPGLLSLSTGRSIASERPIVDSTFDVASDFTFCSRAAMQAYLSHPLHTAFLEEHTRGKVDRILVYDFGN